MVFFQGCRNTTTPQFSESIAKAKKNQTFLGQYIVNNEPNTKLTISTAWVENVWYYDNFWGTKTVEEQGTFYFEIVDCKGFNIERIWESLTIEINQASMNDFERKIGGFKFIGNKVWCEFDIVDAQDLPKEILLDFFANKDYMEKHFLGSIRFKLAEVAE